MIFDIPLLVVAIILLAVFFDFINGFHDAANIVATMISSRSIAPGTALLIAAVAEFLGPFLFGTAVAKTIGKGIVDPAFVDTTIIFAALVGAIFWNLLTWYFGLPSSSSHALVGGLAGSVVAASLSFEHLNVSGFLMVVAVLVTSPIIGFVVGFLIHKLCWWLSRSATPHLNHFYKRAQLLSATSLALSHGANDAQKSMGIITMILLSGGYIADFTVPYWVIFVCALAMGLGTASGGWKIIKTVGSGIYKLRPIHGFTAQTSGTSVILTAALLGGPVSTTHVISSAIMGVGTADRMKAVKWHKAGEIVATWFITIPASAAVSFGAYYLVHLLLG